MKPGPELDAVVAERVMGIEGVNIINGPWGEKRAFYAKESFLGSLMIDEYSTDLAAAWKLVEKLAPGIIAFDIRDEWTACRMLGETFGIIERKGDDVPHSICLTALAAMAHDRD